MAPELYEEKYGTSVDIYAFGMGFLEMGTLSTPYREGDNPAQIYKKVIQGIKPQALDKIDDPEVYDFIVWGLSLADKRPSANDLLCCPFLNDLESETANNAVRLKSDKKIKSGKVDTKSQYTTNSHNKGQVETPADSNTTVTATTTTTSPQNIEPKVKKEEGVSMTKKAK